MGIQLGGVVNKLIIIIIIINHWCRLQEHQIAICYIYMRLVESGLMFTPLDKRVNTEHLPACQYYDIYNYLVGKSSYYTGEQNNKQLSKQFDTNINMNDEHF